MKPLFFTRIIVVTYYYYFHPKYHVIDKLKKQKYFDLYNSEVIFLYKKNYQIT